MQNLSQYLSNYFKEAQRIAVVGVGSDIRGDDEAGILTVNYLDGILKKIDGTSKINIRLFWGGTAPENLSGQIRNYSPTHLLFIDAVDAEKNPGEVVFFSTQEEISGFSFSTHRLPLFLLAEYLNNSIGCKVLCLGIQPKSINFGDTVCDPVRSACLLAAQEIYNCACGK